MVCYYCKNKTSVINSRYQKRKNSVWRRRQCLSCKAILTTSEQYDLETTLLIIDSSKTPTYFNEYKLFLSIYSCFGHSKESLSKSGYITSNIIDLLSSKQKTAQIDTKSLKLMISVALSRYDTLAADQYNTKHP